MTKNLNKRDFSALCFSSDLSISDLDISPILGVRHKDISLTLAAKDDKRLELLAALGNKEIVELEVDIRAFQQQDGVANRNYMRFKNSTLRKFAKSFAGVPLLRDHNSGELEARAGTILSAKAVPIEGGLAFEMTARVTAAFAVKALLEGNLDRFSIGWDFPGLDTLECSECKAEVFTDCYHFPGDKLDNGSRVEFVFTVVDGTEVSAVSVPAVKGTGLEGVRSALSQAGFSRPVDNRDESAEDHNMKNIAKTLGLKNDADESTIVAGIGALLARAETAESALSTERTSHAETTASVAALELKVTELGAASLDRDINALCAEFSGCLVSERDAEGKLSAGKLETEIRKLAAKDIEGARAMLEAIPSQVPALGEVPRSIATLAGFSATEVPVDAVATSDVAKRQRAQLGLSDEDFAKYNSENGTETAHLRDSN